MRRLALILALAITAGLTAAMPASASTTWLCRPGLSSNPCAPPQTTTAFASYTAAGVVSRRVIARRPKIDCFYVYPTVSEEPGPNADHRITPELRSVALFQASRFSQLCRVFAPVYRQITEPALMGGKLTQANLNIAYRDVVAAWTDYLKRYNKGRGVVLIGHSQGATHLERLIRDRIEGRRISRRLVSAVLLGGNVSVRVGSDRGGTFRRVRACRSDAQLGCVIAFSTFDEPPPADAVFGLYRGSALGLEVLCTNPADLRGNRERPLDSIMPTAPFAPGTLIAAGISLLGFTPPQAATTYIESRGLFRGRCVRSDGANVFLIRSVGKTPVLKPSPAASWGLHLLDVNVALGNLVAVVGTQARSYTKRR